MCIRDRRYRAIGGRSPLVGNTLLQARLLQERLDAAGVALGLGGRGVSFHVVPGMRHTAPSIHDAVRRAVTGSDGTIVALIMASHQSERATGAYLREVSASFEGLSAEEGSGAAAPGPREHAQPPLRQTTPTYARCPPTEARPLRSPLQPRAPRTMRIPRAGRRPWPAPTGARP